MDYGAPIGFRIATKHPERIESLIIQNGNAYVEGIDNNFWEPIKAYWKNRDAVNQGLDEESRSLCLINSLTSWLRNMIFVFHF